ncbi:hypothetical protein Y1Q_0002473 [Alligator mississippiensis]|uniref:Uncharacterized protein n=1 Tax=Alligator mississippiensis TaxID=8496 RepID=A0A151NBI0_ALLMI|nr:hypothetical protein Y1Q_0002473 [Alligator mississippiensis]
MLPHSSLCLEAESLSSWRELGGSRRSDEKSPELRPFPLLSATCCMRHTTGENQKIVHERQGKYSGVCKENETQWNMKLL